MVEYAFRAVSGKVVSVGFINSVMDVAPECDLRSLERHPASP
ncbi:MAG TPA: hypothetical protein PLJ69_04030 [Methanothrix sp.]|nr:hypothetical protein [Methanothrix sp.]HNT71921.1 hypothetical protein [Methanothrix sp.]HOI69315.1 hypothetical protein [Methanothrix sp.]HPY72657.1 hypothetical protein [Methanothrix sp.]HQA62098.1 hypothetical protein [Methanothrix sp.]